MKKYLIPKEFHQDLYIFEGHLYDFNIINEQLDIIINGVEYPSLPKNILTPHYLDKVKISLKYLKLDISIGSPGSLESTIKFGKAIDSDIPLDYSGGWGDFGNSNLPTSFILEIICQDIELEFLNTF